MAFMILSRKEAGSDKCPKCSRLNVDFVDLGEDMLACFDCGGVFLTKRGRIKARVRPSVVEFVTTVSSDMVPEVSPEAPGFTCGTCGKVMKTKLALSGHLRSHK
uniref:C2H2-type domain-containing protein n=1 Tax=viral metagenome TaxID=1070528 RepID=A0A6H1Z754_9ZZZZ